MKSTVYRIWPHVGRRMYVSVVLVHRCRSLLWKVNLAYMTKRALKHFCQGLKFFNK